MGGDSVTEPQQSKAASREENALQPSAVDSMIRLAYAALRREFEAWCSYQPAAGELPPVDGVHQMRIAARRMRAALRVFERMLPDGASAHFNAELRWFASALGETRDLDVHMLTIPELTRAAGVPADALEGYESALCRSRGAARTELRRLFASDRKRALMEGLEELLSGPSAAALRRWQSLRIDEGAPLRLRAARRRILKRGRRVSGSDPAERLHRLRI